MVPGHGRASLSPTSAATATPYPGRYSKALNKPFPASTSAEAAFVSHLVQLGYASSTQFPHRCHNYSGYARSDRLIKSREWAAGSRMHIKNIFEFRSSNSELVSMHCRPYNSLSRLNSASQCISLYIRIAKQYISCSPVMHLPIYYLISVLHVCLPPLSVSS